jgi:hypothetical protein
MLKTQSKPVTLRPTNGVLLVLVVLLLFAFGLPDVDSGNAFAQDAADSVELAKDIDKNLRAAERDMFNGKNESADQQMQAISGQIEQLQTIDPGNSKLPGLESKYDRIRKNLDRKLGVTAPASSSSGPPAPSRPAAAAPAAPATASEPEAPDGSALPRAVSSDVANTSSNLDTAEAAWAEDYTGKTTVSGETDPRAVKLDAVEAPLKSANYYYGNILKKCERQSSPCDPGHPEIAALKQRIDAMQANVDGLEGELAAAAAADAEAAAAAAADAAALEAECEAWKERFRVYTDGDKALYRCASASSEQMPACKEQYDEAEALLAEFGKTQWAQEPCDAFGSTLIDLERYMENFASSYERYAAENAAAIANLGQFVFSTNPIDPANPVGLTTQFTAGDTIYGLVQTKKPWSEIYDGKSSADVMVNVKLDDEKIHAQFITLTTPELMAQQHLVFEIAPDPDEMTAYANPDRPYGLSTATMRQGPNELTYHLAQLEPGEHTMAFDITYFGTTWAAGTFTISGDDFGSYAGLHEEIAEAVAQAVTLPVSGKTDKALAADMADLLENAGWEDIHRINIVDKDWWTDRVAGGDSAVKSRHIAAAALARDSQGYYYKVCTFHQDRLISGGFGELYLSHQGDRVPIPEANIDK